MHFSFRAILKQQQQKKTSSTSISSRIHITYTHTHGHIFCTFIFQLMIAMMMKNDEFKLFLSQKNYCQNTIFVYMCGTNKHKHKRKHKRTDVSVDICSISC